MVAMLNANGGNHFSSIPDSRRPAIPTGLDISQGRAIVGVRQFEETIMRRWATVVFLALMATAGASAQAPKPASKTIVLKAARLFDGKSNALVTPGMVVVTDAPMRMRRREQR
jgi:hypothetical protein